MINRYFIFAMGTLAVLVFCFSYLDIVLSFSNKIMWWDSLEHFLGGVSVGFFALWLGSIFGIRVSLITCVAFVFCVGVAWEIMEVMLGVGQSIYMSYWADTVKDIVCDCVGGLVAGLSMRAK
jgi:hypothetical protein